MEQSLNDYWAEMNRRLAEDIFIADGGVDDYEKMSDEQLHLIVGDYLRDMADDYDSRSLIVQAARKLGEVNNG